MNLLVAELNFRKEHCYFFPVANGQTLFYFFLISKVSYVKKKKAMNEEHAVFWFVFAFICSPV